MKALVLQTGGSIDGFCITDMDKPVIKPDELLIKVHAVSLNPSDYQTAEYLTGDNLNRILGLDVAGEVVEVGAEVQGFAVGERVFYLRQIDNPYGGFAQYATSPACLVAKIPNKVSYEQAATLPGAGFTAYHIMKQRFHLTAGKTILIQGGAGGVGSYAIQLAKLAGLRVISTCAKKDKDYVKSLGVDVVIDYQNEAVYAKIRQATGEGVDYIISSIGSQGATADMQILNFGGEIAVTAGFPDFGRWRFYDKGISLHEIAFGAYLTHPDKNIHAIVAQIGNELGQLLNDGKICTPKTQLIALENIPEALKRLKNTGVTGKIVAQITH